ncbi:NUDIX domain-containing protein [Streptomyces sp. NPDC002680]|uniref:NUDIX domain-containing protein n=1 Tax=Streptomyces phaeolivaceus TaxID=2653200 RepID=A0A5P8K597_9ACTN|nr:NUDIX domain-containing protein [Streptomyces phaeolivaceus]QFQ97958.1 NUDIX domain-containing protein [Streptomyces phaeolivaceus]
MGELVEQVDDQDRVLRVVERGEAIRSGWLHRVATTVCRRPDGRILVHRRPQTMSRFPGQYNWLVGGAVDVGESYEEAAARELAEELGVSASPQFVFKYLCRGAISPYWMGIHEVVIEGEVVVDPSEIAWHEWLTPQEFLEARQQWNFVEDGVEALRLYLRRHKVRPGWSDES